MQELFRNAHQVGNTLTDNLSVEIHADRCMNLRIPGAFHQVNVLNTDSQILMAGA